MLLVRPVMHSDLSSIEALLANYEMQLSTLSNQRDFLSERIDVSIKSFSGDQSREGKERFLFVMEDIAQIDHPKLDHEVASSEPLVVGVAGIDAYSGNGAPFYNYRKDELIHSSHQLDVHNRVPVLYMSHELTGKTQLCSLVVRSDYKQGNALALLSRARLMFIALFREYFSREVIVEIQGKHEEDQSSVFWDSLGYHFFDMDFKSANYFSAIKSKTFIAELMPTHPIYVPLLSLSAQAVLGKPNDGASPGYQLLLREGFRTSKHVDIFDGGPTLIARMDDIHTIKNCLYKRYSSLENEPHNSYQYSSYRNSKYMVCNPELSDFRCLLTTLEDHDQTVTLDSARVELLQLQEHDRIAVVPF